MLIYGMRGNVYRTTDGMRPGTRSTPRTSTSLMGSRVLDDGTVVLVGNGGLVATSQDDGQTLQLAQGRRKAARCRR